MGTLGIITDATLYCMPVPSAQSIVRILFPSFLHLLGHINAYMQLIARVPTVVAVELLPVRDMKQEATLLIVCESATAVPESDHDAAHPTAAHPAAVPESDHDAAPSNAAAPPDTAHAAATHHAAMPDRDHDEAHRDARALLALIATRLRSHSLAHLTQSEKEIRALWDLRKGILKQNGSAATMPALVNDLTLPRRHLRPFLRRAFRIFGALSMPLIVYGHIGCGNLHLRPLLAEGRAIDDTILRAVDTIYRLVLYYKGAVGGEHGTGLLRAPYMCAQWGRGGYRIMQELKTLFDPQGIFDPSAIFCPHSLRDQLRRSKVSRQ